MKTEGKILILEDNPGSSYYIIEALKKRLPSEWHTRILCCSNISDANDLFDDNKDTLICLVCDSNMAPIGLKVEERKKSENGLYSGWLWLYTRLCENPHLIESSILYTAYSDEIKDYIDLHPDQKEVSSKIYVVKKRTISGPYGDELVNKILDIMVTH